jgi:hypothetical protein
VAEPVRASNPDRAKAVESRWNDACGAGTTLHQVLEARKNAGSSGRYAREALPRFAAGAAFVFLEELPPANDLALAALAQSSRSVRDDLVNMDAVDDVDLGVVVPDAATRLGHSDLNGAAAGDLAGRARLSCRANSDLFRKPRHASATRIPALRPGRLPGAARRRRPGHGLRRDRVEPSPLVRRSSRRDECDRARGRVLHDRCV